MDFHASPSPSLFSLLPPSFPPSAHLSRPSGNPTSLPAPLKNRKLRQIVPHNVTINADIHVRSEPDDKEPEEIASCTCTGPSRATMALSNMAHAPFFFPLKCSIQFSGDGLSVAVHFQGRGERILLFLQGSQLHSFKCLFLPSGAVQRAAALHLASAKCNLSEPAVRRRRRGGGGGIK